MADSSYSSFQKQKKSSSQLDHFVHGCIGGIAGLLMGTALHPIDTVRTRIKTNSRESVALVTQIKSIYRYEGVTSYYRGFTCTLSGSFFANYSYFYIYGNLKQGLTKYTNLPNTGIPFVAAFFSGMFANAIYLPFICIRTRMQIRSSHYDYNNFFDGLKKMLKKEGFRKLYLGGPAFLTQTAMETSLTFGFYELFRKSLRPFFPKNTEANVPLSLTCGALAASVTAVIVNPIDLVVARMQTMHTSLQGPCTIPQMALRVYKNEGIGGFWKGVTGTIPHYAMASLILFPIYEMLKVAFKVDLNA